MNAKHMTKARPGKIITLGRLWLYFNWARSGVWAEAMTSNDGRPTKYTHWFWIGTRDWTADSDDLRIFGIFAGPVSFQTCLLPRTGG